MQLKLLVLAVISVFATNAAGNYLVEKPPFLNPCPLNDPDFGKCYAANFQVFFKEWLHGVPGLKTIGTLDPLEVKRVKLSHDSNGLSVAAILQNVFVKGLSDVVVKDTKVNGDNFNVDIKLYIPKQRYDFDYKAKGRVLTIPLNGEGTAFFEADNVIMTFHITTKLRSEGENVFMDIQSFKLNMDEIGAFRIRLNNLFGGQKDLEDSANALFNDNWREFFQAIRPAVEQIIEDVMHDRFKKIFNYVPANYFISDLPHA